VKGFIHLVTGPAHAFVDFAFERVPHTLAHRLAHRIALEERQIVRQHLRLYFDIGEVALYVGNQDSETASDLMQYSGVEPTVWRSTLFDRRRPTPRLGFSLHHKSSEFFCQVKMAKPKPETRAFFHLPLGDTPLLGKQGYFLDSVVEISAHESELAGIEIKPAHNSPTILCEWRNPLARFQHLHPVTAGFLSGGTWIASGEEKCWCVFQFLTEGVFILLTTPLSQIYSPYGGATLVEGVVGIYNCSEGNLRLSLCEKVSFVFSENFNVSKVDRRPEAAASLPAKIKVGPELHVNERAFVRQRLYYAPDDEDEYDKDRRKRLLVVMQTFASLRGEVVVTGI